MLVSTVALIRASCGQLPCRPGQSLACPSAWSASLRARARLSAHADRRRVAPRRVGPCSCARSRRVSAVAQVRRRRPTGGSVRRLGLLPFAWHAWRVVAPLGCYVSVVPSWLSAGVRAAPPPGGCNRGAVRGGALDADRLPAGAGGAGGFAERCLPAGRAGAVGHMGRLAWDRHRDPQRGGLQLLPPAARRTLHAAQPEQLGRL